MSRPASVSRRRFVSNSLAGAAAVGLPAIARAGSANNAVVVALVGGGGRGRGVIRQMAALPDVRVKTICDVYQDNAQRAAKEVAEIQKSPPACVDSIRRVLDDREVQGVVIGTPEHWHALASIWSMQAGKDVYVEKNICLYIWEGRKMIEAARKYNRVLQCGTQNRSWPAAWSAREYIASGGLGTVGYVKVFGMLGGVVGGRKGSQEPVAPPAGLDWDQWLGPAAKRPYTAGAHRAWYGCWDFSGGNASDAIHTIDLARITLGDPPQPRFVQCAGGRFLSDDGGDMPDVQIVNYQYDKMVMSFINTGFTPYNIKAGSDIRLDETGEKFPFWPQNADRIEIYGTKRMMYLARHGGGWQVYEGGYKLVAKDKAVHPDKWHVPNFIDCIRSRKDPNGVIEQGHLSACLEHMANIAYRTGNQQLALDPKTETFGANAAANALVRPKYRKPYEVPEVV